MFYDLTTAVPAHSPLLSWAKAQDNPHIAMGHVGTHLDTYEKRPIPLDYVKSPGVCFDVRGLAQVTPQDVDLDRVGPRSFVLFRTGRIAAHPYGDPAYFQDHPQLSQDLIEALTQKGIRFIGVDCPGIRQHQEHTAADRFCERRGVYVIENLTGLAPLPPAGFTVYTLWLDDPQRTGLPCRVIAETQD